MRLTGIVGVFIVVLIIIGAIVVGNFFFSTILGVNVSALPPGLKFVVHLTGFGLMFIFFKKFARR